MKSMDIVVAHYQEDLSWLRRVPAEFNVVLYDKGGEVEDAIALENVGFEAHTYLHHIVQNYDSLADITAFVQGYPFDHIPSFHRRLRDLAVAKKPSREFEWLGFVIDYDDPQGKRLFQPWGKNHDRRLLDVHGFWNQLWGHDAPDRLVFYPGGQFIVTAEQIRQQERTFYEKALTLSVSYPDAGHCLERSWDRVFACNGLAEKFRGRELPIYLRPIRRLGITWDTISKEDQEW